MSNVTSVPLLDPRRANDTIDAGLREAFDRVLSHGKFILGPEVEALEKACAEYLQVDHAIGVSSGTDALIVSLMALRIGPGDEVICPTFTFFATAGAVWRVGATPVFVDSRERCFNIDPEDVAQKITAKTKAIIPVHLFGQCAEMDAINELAKARGIAVIEDAAQAIGAEYDGKRVGGLGTLGCFSFFPSKNLGGFGDAGLVTTNDAGLAGTVRALRVHGGKKMYDHPRVGGNFRIDALQSALLDVKLPQTDSFVARRQANAARYTELLVESGVAAPAGGTPGCGKHCPAGEAVDKPLLLPAACQSRHVYNQYVVRAPEKRDALMAHLKAQGIGCAVYYPRPLHLQPCFADCGGKEGDHPVAEKLAAEVLAIPIFSELTEAEQDYVVAQIVAFFA